jgi:hypothetical protein
LIWRGYDRGVVEEVEPQRGWEDSDETAAVVLEVIFKFASLCYLDLGD